MQEHVKAFLATLESQPAYSLSTRLAYGNDLRCFLGYLERTLRRNPTLADFNARQVASFLEAEHQAGKRQSTLIRRRATLRRFESYLRRQGALQAELSGSDAHLIDKAIEAVQPLQKAQSLNPAEVNHLWAVLESSQHPRARRDQAILALLLETGLTVGTLVDLDLADVDTRSGGLRLYQDRCREFWVSLGSANEPLQRYLKEGRPELNYSPDQPALFISQTGGRMSRQGVWQVLRHWGREINLPVTLSPRLARHTAVLRMACSGRAPAEIQILLGHSNPLSTRALLRRLGVAGKAGIEE